MAREDGSLVIGIPELYSMIKEMDEKNEKRDAELKKILVGNGELGVVGKVDKNKSNIAILFRFLIGIITSILGIAFIVIRMGLLS